jgi:flagellar biosynthesis/type III secretory pathway M-ring protein FliF/YscJ
MSNQLRKPVTKVTAAEIEVLKERITQLIQKRPEKAATILTLWVNQGNQVLKRIKAG